MTARKFVGNTLLILGPLFILVWIGICILGALLGAAYNEESLVFTDIAGPALIGLTIGTVITLGGWFLTHPARGKRTRKAVGLLLLVLGVCCVGLSIAMVIFGFPVYSLVLVFFGLVAVGGWLLLFPLKKKRQKRIVATFQSDAELDRQSEHL